MDINIEFVWSLSIMDATNEALLRCIFIVLIHFILVSGYFLWPIHTLVWTTNITNKKITHYKKGENAIFCSWSFCYLLRLLQWLIVVLLRLIVCCCLVCCSGSDFFWFRKYLFYFHFLFPDEKSYLKLECTFICCCIW